MRAHLFLVSDLVELLRGVVARLSNVAVRRDSDSSSLLETAVLKRALQRVRLGAIQSEIEHQTYQQTDTHTRAKHHRHRSLPQL